MVLGRQSNLIFKTFMMSSAVRPLISVQNVSTKRDSGFATSERSCVRHIVTRGYQEVRRASSNSYRDKSAWIATYMVRTLKVRPCIRHALSLGLVVQQAQVETPPGKHRW